MATIGPSLPPHLSGKRKRSNSASSEEGPAPAQPSDRHSKNLRRSSSSSSSPGVELPPKEVDHEIPQTVQPKAARKTFGPSLPPAPLDQMLTGPGPSLPPDGHFDRNDDSSDSDDLGPALPSAHDAKISRPSWEDIRGTSVVEADVPKALQREDWMLAPPSGADWAQRIDTTKLKARGFNTKKGAKGSRQAGPSNGSGMSGLWTETPEEKRKRLESEVLGESSKNGEAAGSHHRNGAEMRTAKNDEETKRKVQKHDEAHRGSASLMEMHRSQARSKGKEVEDDPSKRAFDREKDIAGGTASAMQQRDFLNRAKDMGNRFEKARYL